MHHGLKLSPGVGGGASFPKKDVVIEGLAPGERKEIPLREGGSINFRGRIFCVKSIVPAASGLWGTNTHEASLSLDIPGATMSINERVSADRPYLFGPYAIGILDANKETATFEIRRLG